MPRTFIFFLLYIIIASCIRCNQSDVFISDTAFANKMCNTDNVSFHLTSKSAVSCGVLCLGYPGCHGFIFYKPNNTCFGVNSNVSVDVWYHLQGATFYQIAATAPTEEPVYVVECSTSSPMVVDVTDDQMTSSTTYSTLLFQYLASLGRLDGSNAWISFTTDSNQYIQVDFESQRVVTAVVTQGAPVSNCWVTEYKVYTSGDCLQFDAIANEDGTDTIFTGNSDVSTHVTNAIDPPVLARCIRVNPVAWNNLIAIRLEVLGCML